MRPTAIRTGEDSEAPAFGPGASEPGPKDIKLTSIRCDNHPDRIAVYYRRSNGERLCKECL